MKQITPGTYRHVLIPLLTLLCTSGVRAVTVDDFVARIYTNAQGTLPYRLFIPTNYTPVQKYPLVLFLHGAGERGTDNRLQLTGQTGPLVFATATNQSRYPSFMVAPQCPPGASWDDNIRRQQILGLMNLLQSQYGIDSNRWYITGLSMGGYGTWDQITQFPTLYAAAVPMSAGGVSGFAPRIINIPIWNFHAANDGTVNVSGSRAMVGAVRTAGGNVIYTEYATGGHVIWTPAYNTPTLMNWVYAQRRGIPATNTPILAITAPTVEPLYASTNISSLNLAGQASDGNATVTQVTWTNYQDVTLSGIAIGTNNWSVSNLPLSGARTNNLLVTAKGTSWYPTLGGNTTFNDTLKVIFPPFIMAQPESRLVNQGNAVAFSLTLGSARLSPTYQWRLNGTNLPGSTSASLVLTNVQIENAGVYSVRVSNPFGFVLSSNATLSVNRLPVANPQTLSVNEDSPLAITLSGSDADGDALSYAVTSPSHGTLSGLAPDLVYQPSSNYHGPDSFAFKVNDGKIDSASVVIAISVAPVNDAPLAEPQAVSVNEDSTVAITLTGSDVDGDVLTYSVTGPANGDLSGTAPNLIYRPKANYFGRDGFSFQVSDGQLASAAATVSITVVSVNDAPVAVARISPLFHLTSNDTSLVVIARNNTNAPIVFDGSLSSDVENDPLQYSWVEGGNGQFATGVVVTNAFDVGSHTVELLVSDGADRSTNTVTFAVITPAKAVAELIALVDHVAIERRNKHPLIVSLTVAIAAFDRGSFGAGINQLQAFQNKVRAQVAPSDPSSADTFLQGAQAIIDALVGAEAGLSSSPILKIRGQITSIARHANGGTHIHFFGASGEHYAVQASANLNNWETIGTPVDNGSGWFEFEDTASHPARFYRIIVPEQGLLAPCAQSAVTGSSTTIPPAPR